jgi:integrase
MKRNGTELALSKLLPGLVAPSSLENAGQLSHLAAPILELRNALDHAVSRSRLLVAASTLKVEIQRHLEQKFARKAYTRASVEGKAITLRAFVRALGGDCRLEDVTTAAIQRYYDDSFCILSSASAHKRLMDVRAFFRWAFEQRKMAYNPAAEVRPESRPASSRIRYCTRALRDRLIEQCPNEDLRLILMLGFHAGLRKNEIIQAIPSWFNLELGFVDLHDTASMRFTRIKRGRTVPLTRELKSFLQNYGLRSPFLLRPDVIQRHTYYRYNFAKSFRKYMRSQAVEWVTPHVMRHTFASLLAIDGKSIYKIAAWLGDSVKVTESVYAHLSPQDEDVNLSRP